MPDFTEGQDPSLGRTEAGQKHEKEPGQSPQLTPEQLAQREKEMQELRELEREKAEQLAQQKDKDIKIEQEKAAEPKDIEVKAPTKIQGALAHFEDTLKETTERLKDSGVKKDNSPTDLTHAPNTPDVSGKDKDKKPGLEIEGH